MTNQDSQNWSKLKIKCFKNQIGYCLLHTPNLHLLGTLFLKFWAESYRKISRNLSQWKVAISSFFYFANRLGVYIKKRRHKICQKKIESRTHVSTLMWKVEGVKNILEKLLCMEKEYTMQGIPIWILCRKSKHCRKSFIYYHALQAWCTFQESPSCWVLVFLSFCMFSWTCSKLHTYCQCKNYS